MKYDLKVYSWVRAKILSANEIADFSSKLHIKLELMNLCDLWLSDVDSNNVNRWFVNFWLGMIKNACSQSNFEIIKSAISQEKPCESVWFFACWDRLKKIKCWLNFFDLVKSKRFLVKQVANVLNQLCLK